MLYEVCKTVFYTDSRGKITTIIYHGKTSSVYSKASIVLCYNF